MKTTVKRWGNSLAIRLPKVLAKEIAFDEGDEVDITANKGALVFTHSRPEYRLNDLLNKVTKTNSHKETDFGKAVGKEIW